MGFLTSIEESALGIYIREDLWGFPIALSMHAVGMALALGVVIVTTSRVLGYVREIPVQSYSSLFMVAWLGFIINLISGIMLYASHATEYTYQLVFMLKLGLILLGGILMKVMMHNVREGSSPAYTRLIAGLCLASWIGAVITGRLMAYS